MLRIRLKVDSENSNGKLIPLGSFFHEYFNGLFEEIHAVLADYRSVQEHANRNKIIEFVGEKQNDLSLLYMVVEGAFLEKYLWKKWLKKKKYEECSSQLVDVADFVAGMYERMKYSFVPRYDFVLALQARIEPEKLLMPSLNREHEEAAAISELAFAEITRLMTLYLVKEDIKEYEIKQGILQLKFEFFTFYLVLCGEYSAPEWRILRIESILLEKTKMYKLERQIISKLQPNIKEIQNFNTFYEHRRLALEIWEITNRNVEGFFMNFKGQVNDAYISGCFKNGNFYCSVNLRGEEHQLVNPKPSYIQQLVKIEQVPETANISYEPKGMWNFLEDGLDNNYVHLDGEFFYSFHVEVVEFGIGLYSSGRALSQKYAGFDLVDGKLVAVPTSYSKQVMDSTKLAEFKINFVILVDNFVFENASLLPVLYSIISLPYYFSLNSILYIAGCSVCKNYSLKIDNFGIQCKDKNELCRRIELIIVGKNIPLGYNLVSHIFGSSLILSIYDISINISDQLTTNIEILTEDCNRFSLNDALLFIRWFGLLYKNHLFPLVLAYDMIMIDLHSILDERLVLRVDGEYYNIEKSAACQVLKLPDKIRYDDPEIAVVLYRAYLVARFYDLERVLGGLRSEDGKQLCLNNGSRIRLTADGIQYISQNGTVNEEISQVINNERDMLLKVKEFANID